MRLHLYFIGLDTKISQSEIRTLFIVQIRNKGLRVFLSWSLSWMILSSCVILYESATNSSAMFIYQYLRHYHCPYSCSVKAPMGLLTVALIVQPNRNIKLFLFLATCQAAYLLVSICVLPFSTPLLDRHLSWAICLSLSSGCQCLIQTSGSGS